MSGERAAEERDSSAPSKSATPSITRPKGGGAIKGIGEKFAANPVTGTGSMSTPIATSPGRSGFGPQLSLSYDSGSGNGPFGFGWSLSLPAIARKTDKGLPQYHDAIESDVFLLSGAEDLVPVLIQNGHGKWERESLPTQTVKHVAYRIDRYRPRIEGLFARIERWTNTSDATDVFWRSISKDNITTWYGKTADSRIADPADPSRIFSWLICQSHDDKSHVIAYGYKREDSERILEDASGTTQARAHESNHTDAFPSAQRYLKRIRYGNQLPYFPVLAADNSWPEPADATGNTRDPNLKLVDLDGDGHADVLITEDDALVWHASLAEAGFGAARRVAQQLDEEKGPRLLFADGSRSVYMADLSGDGLTDLVRIRNGEVCYCPNLGYGRFGAKVTMDHSPWFDNAEQFDQKGARLERQPIPLLRCTPTIHHDC